MQLRRRQRVVIEQVPTRTVTLLESHLRPGGERTPHSCKVCCSVLRMKLDDGAYPKWTQCPECQDVMHQSCFDRWVLNGSGSDSLKFSCPSCRHEFDRNKYESNPDPWSAADVQSTLVEEVNESDDDNSSKRDDSDDESDDGDSDGDSDDDDDSDSNEEPPAKRITRQSGGLAETLDARSLRRKSRSR